MASLAGCGAAGRLIPCEDDNRCLRYAITADIPILDPHFSDLPEAGMVFRQVYDTLLYRDPEHHHFAPGLATDWEISPDGLQYTFHLRRDVSFHDGSPFRAAAVARNIERIYQPGAVTSLARQLLGPLHKVEVLDDHTIRLRLFEPHAALLDGLAQPYLGIASAQALDRNDDLRYQYHQAGTGPFVLEDYLPGERIVLRRFDAYALERLGYSALAGDEINRVELSILGDGENDLLSVLGSTQDVVDAVLPAAARTLTGNSRVKLLPVSIPGLTIHWLFNTEREHLAKREVRLALLLATNRIAISNQIYLNTAAIAWSPLSQSTGYAHTGLTNVFEYDLAQARALLSEAGYADSDGDGILDLAGETLEIKVLAPPWGQLPEAAAFLRDEWRQIGVNVIVEPAPGKTQLDNMIRSGAYDLIPVREHGIDPGILGRVYYDNSAYWPARAQHPALNEMLRQAAQELDPASRRAQYYGVQALLMNKALLLPISERVRLRAVSAEVVGLRYDAYGFYPLLAGVRIAAD